MKIVRALSERTMDVLEMGSRGWYRDHAAHSLTCGCSLSDPDPDCNVGYSLHVVATRPQESVRQDVFIREMRR